MTRAICIRCGHEKFGALIPCAACKDDPQARPLHLEALAKALILTDHYHSREALREESRRIQAGEPARVDPQMLAAWIEELRQSPDLYPEDEKGPQPLLLRMSPWGCFLLLVGVVGVAGTLVGVGMKTVVRWIWGA
ncbi:hypothetical protein ACLESO_25325 [Pyxidicoccus sp. 3LG]